MLVLNLPAFESKKYAAYDHFHGNGPYGKILTKNGPIRMLGFALPYNNVYYYYYFYYYYLILPIFLNCAVTWWSVDGINASYFLVSRIHF